MLKLPQVLSQRDSRWASILLTMNSSPIFSSWMRKHFSISMNRFMFFLGHQFKIFYSIICFYSIYVMNVVFISKQSANFLRNNFSMKINISFTIRHWISIIKNFNVTVSINGFSSRPSGIIFSSIFPFYKLTKFILFHTGPSMSYGGKI